MTYQDLGDAILVSVGDTITVIPKDERNLDYREYLTWLAEGNTPLPYVDPAAALTAGAARTQRQEARKQAQAAKLARRGDDLGAVKLLVGL